MHFEQLENAEKNAVMHLTHNHYRHRYTQQMLLAIFCRFESCHRPWKRSVRMFNENVSVHALQLFAGSFHVISEGAAGALTSFTERFRQPFKQA